MITCLYTWLIFESLADIIENRLYRFITSAIGCHTVIPYILNWNIADFKLEFVPPGDARMVTVPDKHIFVKGDGIMSSDDSITHGPVPFYMIKGIMLCKLYKRTKQSRVENSNPEISSIDFWSTDHECER